MKEVIVRLTSDHIKVKGGEYVRDLVCCGDCKHWDNRVPTRCTKFYGIFRHSDDFCSSGVKRDE